MKKKPSLEDFRRGGGEGEAGEAAQIKSAPQPAERSNKTIRLRKAFEAKLKEESYVRSTTEGRRVTESDIIDQALEKYFAKS